MTNSKDTRSLHLDDFKVAIVELFKQDVPKRKTLSQKVQNSPKSTKLAAKIASIMPDLRKESIEIGLESEKAQTITTTMTNTKQMEPLETIDGKITISLYYISVDTNKQPLNISVDGKFIWNI